MKHPLLTILLAAKPEEFTKGFTDLLISRDFSSFTLWEIESGSICTPISNVNGISEGTFDIYDLGYTGESGIKRRFAISYFGNSYIVYAVIFFSVSKRLKYALSLHSELSIDAYEWLSALRPIIENRLTGIFSSEQNVDLFVDYQKKIDFIKDCAQILKLLSIKEIIVNSLNFFSETFCAEAACALYDDNFEGFGVNRKDIETSISVNSIPLYAFVAENNEFGYFEERLYSAKFNIFNLFIIKDNISHAFFVLFNITADPLPDREFSVLISNIVGIAIENALYHERATKLLVEETEMSQTVDILNRFVKRETELESPELFGVNYPAKSTGGDFFTVIEKEERVFICVADVCGKGYSAAVFTVMLAAIIESGGDELWNLPILLKKINSYMLTHSFDDRFITGVFSIYDKRDGSFSYISCGHEPIFIVKGGISAERLMSSYLPLGLSDEEFQVQSAFISSGELIFIYTDGVVEYISHNLLEEKLIVLSDESPEQIVKTLYKQLVSLPEKQRDDFTCVAIKG
ncbi:MAG: serine/threonine-protein phosphatase [Deferribacteraceae bacterium]|jgi:serine phosphatase RsbU (regulator of sigma subunit)|nr:serine/threonine-protein phosphatase [Deferribacteraceae bacterium]